MSMRHFACICLCTMCAAPEEARHPGTGASHRWAMGIKSWSSARAVSACDLSAISPSL